MIDWIKLSEVLPPLHTPIQLLVKETVDDIYIEYYTMGCRVGEDMFEIMLPKHPENNIDELWSSGNAYVLSFKEGNQFVVGINSERKFTLEAWKELG